MIKYIICFIICLFNTFEMLEYGEYDIALTHFELCRGPKRKNCVDIPDIKQDSTSLSFEAVIKENMSAIKGKVIGTLNNKEIIKFQIKNICEHVFFKPLFNSFFNISNGSRCEVLKGHYYCHIDTETTARRLYGNKFMYGNWTFKSLFYNDYCNMHCNIITLAISPKRINT